MAKAQQTAFIMIDMQLGFIRPESALCVAGAAATVQACAKALGKARELNMPIFHVFREYAVDGSDVEPTRYATWLAGGKPLSAESAPHSSIDAPTELAPTPDEFLICKPRFSAFFGTDLHTLLQDHGVRNLVLTGTATPNCVRSTCYDALSYNYNVMIVEDCTSSRTASIQAANIADMAAIGAHIISCKEFCETGVESLRDIAAEQAAHVAKERALRRDLAN